MRINKSWRAFVSPDLTWWDPGARLYNPQRIPMSFKDPQWWALIDSPRLTGLTKALRDLSNLMLNVFRLFFVSFSTFPFSFAFHFYFHIFKKKNKNKKKNALLCIFFFWFFQTHRLVLHRAIIIFNETSCCHHLIIPFLSFNHCSFVPCSNSK